MAIVDSDFPGMSGAEFADLIQSTSELTATRIILLVPFSQRSFCKEVVLAGDVSMIPKPVMEQDLYDALLRRGASSGAKHSLEALDQSLTSLSHKRVLVVDDNAVNLKVACRFVEKLGYQAVPVASGQQAVEAAQQEDYALILMDCQMPEMDGFQATREIRAHQRGRTRVPVIAVTANALQGDRERCLAAGMDDYVSKPIGLAALREAVERCGESHAPAAKSAAAHA
jgi:CheY-like chemotaxis protein